MEANLLCSVREIPKLSPNYRLIEPHSDEKGTGTDMAIMQTMSSAGKEMLCRKLWMLDVMSTTRVLLPKYSQLRAVLSLRRRIRLLRILVSRARSLRRTLMFVSCTA
jgi:hypothetical protein